MTKRELSGQLNSPYIISTLLVSLVLMEQEKSVEVVSVVRSELPLPEKHFREMGIGSRATFWRGARAGLRVLHVGGRRFIRPSELEAFIEKIGATHVVGGAQ